MTKKEREQLTKVYEKINRIVNWNNKNLQKRQYYDLLDCVDILKELLKRD